MGWDGAAYSDDSHSRGHWAACSIFSCSEYFRSLAETQSKLLLLSDFIGGFVCLLVILYCLILSEELLGFFSLVVYNPILKYHFKF